MDGLEMRLYLNAETLRRIDAIVSQYQTAGRKMTREEVVQALIAGWLLDIERDPPPSRVVLRRERMVQKSDELA